MEVMTEFIRCKVRPVWYLKSTVIKPYPANVENMVSS